MIRPIHSSTSTGSLDVSFLAFLHPDEIKVISHTMHFRLCQVAPVAVAQRLPNSRRLWKAPPSLKIGLNKTLNELQRGVIHVVSKISAGVSSKFNLLVEDIKRNRTWGNEFKELVGQ